MSSWICCQLGAREHYAVPRALQIKGLLREFITDLWIRPGTLLHRSKNQLTGRFHPGLASFPVAAPNLATLTYELKAIARGVTGWKLIHERNEWFQDHAVVQLARCSTNGHHTVFAYSYAAEKIFRFARERGWKTILGQIDPGPTEERIVAGLHANSSTKWEPAPAAYWDRWRAECSLADRIVVNSNWSKEALLAEGVPAEKINIVPVAYECDAEVRAFHRKYPDRFTSERPLRVLFLGQVNLRKGVAQLLEAIKLLNDENIEFWFVGPVQISIPAELKDNRRVKWFGAAARLDVARFYQDADVFIFPTLSDGFGLTQLEAQSWKLPVVASRNCGEVVHHGINGLILEEVSGPAIADVLRKLARSPETLNAMSQRSGVAERFSLTKLASALASL